MKIRSLVAAAQKAIQAVRSANTALRQKFSQETTHFSIVAFLEVGVVVVVAAQEQYKQNVPVLMRDVCLSTVHLRTLAVQYL